MSGLWIPRGFQKPPMGARINWGHPLAAGLVIAALPDGSPTAYFDLTSGSPASALGTISVGSGVGGAALITPSAGGAGAIVFDLTRGFNAQSPVYTHLAIVSLTAAPPTWGGIFSLCSADGSQQVTGIQRSSSTTDLIVYHAASGDSGVGGGNYDHLISDTPRALALRSNNASFREVFLDGNPYFSGSGGLAPTSVTDARLVLGGERGGSSNSSPCRYYAHFAWSRVLSDSEIAAVSTEPYAMLTR